MFRDLLIGIVVVIFCVLTVVTGYAAQSVYQRQMDVAIQKDDLKTARSMLEKGAFVSALSLSDLVQCKPETIKFLLDNGYEIYDEAGVYTNLFMLSSSGTLEKVKLFLAHNVSPSGVTEYGKTTLFTVTETLFGFNPFKSQKKVSKDTEDAFSYFISRAQKDLNAPGNRPIDIALGMYRWHQSKVAKFLINAGTNVNQCSGPLNRTPLMNAVIYGDMDLVVFILSKGAEINFACDGYTALGLAQKKNSQDQAMMDIEMMLMDKGARP